ncbi:hypothetical protein [Pyxidicoccus sp. MSG2]|uniref:hypothetical protein n=1 Tax=Pyxidicoccus sp. MSG2 TaxID=2996790 RepID=UPI00227165C5|nr:hypothetical protein [Pyxidicoccus sp. MSG2]MCY1022710.1 hypothetical protein [Pyxidicoccus sp. MSG2]
MGKKKSDRVSKNRSEVVQLRNMLRGTKQPRSVLGHARNTLAPELFKEAAAWLHATPLVARRVLPSGYPRTFSQYGSDGPLPATTPVREFRWAVANLVPHAASLSEFVTYAAAFHRAFLADDFATCTTLLDDIEQRFGQSLWLIKHRLPLLQAMSGLEAQKQYAESVRFSDNANPFIARATYFTSIRTEPSVTPGRFRSQFEVRVRKMEQSPGYLTRLRFHVCPSIIQDPQLLAEILRREQAGSVIDYYEAFVCISQFVVVTGQVSFASFLVPELGALYARTGDPRLGAILAGVGATPPGLPPAHPAALTAADALLRGHPERALAEAAAALASNPADPDALLVAARAASMLPNRMESHERPLSQRIVSWMAGVIAKDASVSKDSIELVKLALNFFGAPWANTLLGLVEQENASDLLLRGAGYAQLAALSIPAVHPLRTLWLPLGGARERYAQHMERLLDPSDSSAYALATADPQRTAHLPEGILWEERTLLEAVHAFSNGNFQEALAAANRLERSSYAYYRHRAIRLACPALLHLGQTEDCVDRLTSAYVAERTTYALLPIEAAATAVASDEKRPFAANLSIPILFELYTRHVDNHFDSECMFACTEFLDAHGINRPTDLRGVYEKFDRKKLIYFLRYVCVESIMDRSKMFDSSRALLEERLGICQLLIEIDADGVEAYHTEIKTLLRRLMLQKRMKEVEQSKIFVDTDSIKRTVAEDLREAFSRFMALKNERKEFGDSPELEAALEKASSGDLTGLNSLELPQNETIELFESLIRRLREEYLLSPEHGLAKYLSVRIRHGTLAAHLRKPVELARLVTRKESSSGGYKQNEHWPKRIKGASAAAREWLTHRLAAFSKEFDTLVADVNARIQIRKAEEETGLFALELPRAQYRVILLSSKLITPETTFEQFVDHGLELFGNILDEQLKGAREYITLTPKARASELLERLAADIDALDEEVDTGELTHAIRTAKTELNVAFDRVAAWFRRARLVANEPFPLEDAIDIGAETVRTVVQDFRAEIIDRKEAALLLPGLYLATFVDIFFIIFENIVRHASLKSRPSARVSISISEQKLHIRVENELGQGVATAEARARLDNIKATMGAGLHGPSVNREGGTGMHKLGKLLAHDLGVSPDLDFGFSDDTHFFVRFSVPERIRAPLTPL